MSIFIVNKFVLLITLGLLVSCALVNKEPIHIESGKVSFSVIPKEIVLGNTFTITLPELRPSSLFIKDPTGVWHIIHDPSDEILYLNESDYSTTDFLEVSTSLKGVSWKDGKRINVGVFTVPGKYIIYSADNLETEPENTFSLMTSIILKAAGEICGHLSVSRSGSASFFGAD